MKVIDLTHKISNDTPVYPGTMPPSLTPAASYDKDGYKETLYHMFSHTGTHIDAPAHIFEGRRGLDSFPTSHFVGKAFALDASSVGEGGRITMDILEPHMDLIGSADFLLFYTGYGSLFYSKDYFGAYPVIDEGVLDFIIKVGFKGIGFDTISLDQIDDYNLTMHKKLFSSFDVINVENLTNLDKVAGKLFDLVCLPLSIAESDGAPCRAIAMIEE